MMYDSVYHWHLIVNGTGGFAPPGYLRDVPLYSSFPARGALDLLHGRGVRYVIVHRDWLGRAASDAIRVRAAHVHGVRLVAHWPAADAYLLR